MSTTSRQTTPPAPLRVGLRPPTSRNTPASSLPVLTDGYKQMIHEALVSPTDLLAERILANPDGATFDLVKDFFPPIMYGISGFENGSFMTDTGVYYIPFGRPIEPTGLADVALTVADGSQIISNRVGTLTTRFYVGAAGKELFGSHLASLCTPQLHKGYLPILELDYTDSEGVQYHQESFVSYLPGTDRLSSFVKITAASGSSERQSTTIRVKACDNNNLRQEGNRLVDDRNATYLCFSSGCSFYNTDLTYSIDFTANSTFTVYIVRPIQPPHQVPELIVDFHLHAQARTENITYWERRLGEGRLVEVPESRIMDAQRNLLIQNLLMTWRYSIGNAYQAFYQPESSSTMGIMGRFGYAQVYRHGLQDLLTMSKGENRRNFEMGEKLSHAADYYRLTGDSSMIDDNLDMYIAFADDLAEQHTSDPHRLLEAHRYSSDVTNVVYGLHQIGMALYGLQSMTAVWREMGKLELAAKYEPVAQSLRAGLDEAVKASSVTLPDGSLFTAVSLLADEEAYPHVAATYLGSYWNLVVHYAFSSQLYAPSSPEAVATLNYLYNHGARLLGQLKVRDGAINDVYAVENTKFMADNDQADQLVLSFYGHLAHALTRNTLIAGEAANIGPLASKWPLQFGAGRTPPSFEDGWAADEYYRGIYLSPNSANNAFFLQLLRMMLIHEVTTNRGEPAALRLGYFTPRGWLEHGKRVSAVESPTLFGPISLTIDSQLEQGEVLARLELPRSAGSPPIGSLMLRLRVPGRRRISEVHVNDVPHSKFDPDDETIDLTGFTGTVLVRACYA
ncbi:hypothetical protein [Paenibacillus koleovorans]|uniref:hypothetical protein n=1 Tax=Paenibacillus koleovorans TaxID=121608 RepID=UPI000FD8FFF0|nr:hypothetical protein [Paenibacillus koleovorans]